METVGHWRLLSSVAKAWGEGEPDCILIDSQGEHHLTCRRLVALSCPLLSKMEALTRLDQVAVSLPASGAVVEGLLKMIAGQRITSDQRHTLKEVVSLSVLLGLGKPNDFIIDEPSSGGNLPALSNDGAGTEDLMEDNWGPILEAVTIEEEDRDEERAAFTPNVMVSIELLDDEDATDNNPPDDPEPNNIVAMELSHIPRSTNTSSTIAGTSRKATTISSEKHSKSDAKSFVVCQCPKNSSTRKRKQTICKVCEQQRKKKGVKELVTRKGPRRGLAQGWQDGPKEEEVLGVKDGRWRGPRFPCNQCKYVACRQANLNNHKASKHEGVMFMDSYISDYFAKNKLVFI